MQRQGMKCCLSSQCREESERLEEGFHRSRSGRGWRLVDGLCGRGARCWLRRRRAGLRSALASRIRWRVLANGGQARGVGDQEPDGKNGEKQGFHGECSVLIMRLSNGSHCGNTCGSMEQQSISCYNSDTQPSASPRYLPRPGSALHWAFGSGTNQARRAAGFASLRWAPQTMRLLVERCTRS